MNQIDDKQVVQYIGHPTTHKLYGTFPSDYHSPYSLLDTLYNNVDDLDAIPFKSAHKIAVVSNPDEWISRFIERYPSNNEDRSKRISEAILSLRWAINLNPTTVNWLENPYNQISITATNVIALTKHNQPGRNLQYIAKQMLVMAEKVAS